MALLLLPAILQTPPAVAEFREVLRPPLKEGVRYAWWDPAWHFRIPVMLRPRMPDELTRGPGEGPVFADIDGVENFPAAIELDFTSAVKAVGEDGASNGWPRDALGRLSSFTLDAASIRVVAYNWESGEVLSTLGREGLLSSAFFPTLLENPEKKNSVFNASSNAVGTVFSIIPGRWTTQLLVFVYFDILENGAKTPVTYPELDAASLETLHWTRTGTHFFGYVPARQSGSNPFLEVIGTVANTTVRISTYGRFAGGTPRLIPRCADAVEARPCVESTRINPRTGSNLPNLHVGEILRVPPTGADYYFRVEATKPVLAYLRSSTGDINSVWFPALNGGIVGTEFLFTGLGNAVVCAQCDADKPNSLRILAMPVTGSAAAASVVITNLESGATTQLSVPRGTSKPLLGYAAGNRYHVISTAPIALASTGYADGSGLPGVTPAGAASGRIVIAPVSTLTTVLPKERADVYIHNLDEPRARYPPGEGVKAIAASGTDRSWSYYQTDHQVRGEMWVARSTVDTSFYGGNHGLWAFPGAKGGTEFVIPFLSPNGLPDQGPFGIIAAMYNETVVTVENLMTGQVVVRRAMGMDDFFIKRSNDIAPVLAGRDSGKATIYRVTSTKPIAIYGLYEPTSGVFNTILAGRTRSPEHEIGPASFYGCVVGWNAKDKALSGTFKPGDKATFRLRVLNLGSGIGGDTVLDDIAIAKEQNGGNEKWKVTVSPTLVSSVPSDAEREISVQIDVPSDAKRSDAVEIVLTARSQCNSRISDVASVRVTVQTKYEFDLRFLPSNVKAITRVLGEGENRTFVVNVKNVGTGADEVRFSLSKVGEVFGFRSSLKDSLGRDLVDAEGRPILAVPLDVGESRNLTLFVAAPATRQSLPGVDYTVEGESLFDSSARDQVTATLLLNAQTAVRIDTNETELPVAPGQDAVFNLTVVNLGVASEVDVSFVAALRRYPGWNITLSTDRVVLGSAGSPEDRATVLARVRAGPGSPVDTVLSLKVLASPLAESSEESPGAALVLTARVRNNFNVTVEGVSVEGPPRSADPGERLSIDFILTSVANGNFSGSLVPTRLPAGWSLRQARPAGAFALAPGGSVSVVADVSVRANERSGSYLVGMGLVMEDATTKERTVREIFTIVKVRRVLDLNVTIPAGLQAPPSGTVRVPAVLRNVGNDNLTVRLDVESPVGWRAVAMNTSLGEVTFAPGEERVVEWAVRAPPRGVAAPAALRLRATGLEVEQATPFTVGVLRRDLSVVSVSALTESFRVGDTAVFEVAVRNNGTLAANDVEVALVVDGAVARNFTVRSLPAGETRAFPIIWTVTRAGAVTVAIDPRERIEDDDRANNAFTLTFEEGQVAGRFAGILPTPGAPLAALLLALVLFALVLRRRSPW